MRYTKQIIIVSQSRVSAAGERVVRQRQLVERLEAARHPADHAASLLLVMEQSLLSMRRFLSTLERDLEISLGVAEKPLRRKAERYRAKSNSDVAQNMVDVLRQEGIDAEAVSQSKTGAQIEAGDLPVVKT